MSLLTDLNSLEYLFDYVCCLLFWGFVCFETGFHSAAQGSLELIKILLLQFPQYWDYRCELSHLAPVLFSA